MSALRQRSRAADEAGISLVEVIVYTALSALLLSILGGLFYVGFQTQAAAGGRDAATGAAMIVSNSLQAGVRKASLLQVTSTLLKARVARGTTDWQCVTWVLTADKKLKYKSSLAAITDTDYSSSTWTVLAVGASGGFSDSGAATVGPGLQVSYSLALVSGGITVPVVGTVTASARGTGSPESC